MTAAEQAGVFAAMAVCGAAAGGVYDLLRSVRGGLVHLLDLVWGMLAACGMIITALSLRTDAFRLYVFAGFGLGLALYMLTIGTIVRVITIRVQDFVKKRKNMNKNMPDIAGK